MPVKQVNRAFGLAILHLDFSQEDNYLFVRVDALCPGQQLLSQVGTFLG